MDFLDVGNEVESPGGLIVALGALMFCLPTGITGFEPSASGFFNGIESRQFLTGTPRALHEFLHSRLYIYGSVCVQYETPRSLFLGVGGGGETLKSPLFHQGLYFRYMSFRLYVAVN